MRTLRIIIGVWLLATTGVVLSAQGHTFHVDAASGDDGRDGLKPETAWRSLAKVNRTRVAPGDRVLFRRGQQWRGQLLPQSGNATGTILYGAFGEGNKPVLLGSVSADRLEDWQPAGEGVWSTLPLRFEPVGVQADLPQERWALHQEAGASCTFSVEKHVAEDSTVLRLNCRSPGTRANHLQLSFSGLTVQEGEHYLFTFRAQATRPFTPASVSLMKSGPPWTAYATTETALTAIGTNWAEYAIRFRARQSAADARFTVFLGGALVTDTTLLLRPERLMRVRGNQAVPLNVDVGNIIFDHGKSTGVKKWSEAELRQDGDYYYDARSWQVKVRADGNPAARHQSIELALRQHIIDQSERGYVTYENLDLRYGAAHGIGGGHQTTRPDGKPVRYGNGIEFWSGARHCLVEDCRIWEVYDAALTNQGDGTNVQENITYRRNVIWNSEYSFEYWNRGPASRTRDLVFEHNTCVDAGHGWGHRQRPDPNGCHLMFYDNSAATTNVVIRGNLFCGATESLLRLHGRDWTAALAMDYNCWFQPRGPWLLWGQQTVGAKDFAAFMRPRNLDLHSLLADPKFLDAARRDYRLAPDSPARAMAGPGKPAGALVVEKRLGQTPPSAAAGPLRLHPTNPRYFTDGTTNADGSLRAVYLTGSHTWNNLKDMGPTDPPAAFDFGGYLDFLEEHHHNFIRLWAWELSQYRYDGKLTYAPGFPWPRLGPGSALDGKPKFDLAKFDAAYFDRLRARVEAAGQRGLYVSVMLFEGHGLHASDTPWCWQGHPFNAGNNLNGVNGDPNGDGRGLETQMLAVPAVTAVQEAYVRKTIETLNGLDNVLYEIVNESGAYSTAWQYHFIRFIHEQEQRLPKQHPVGMTFQYARDARQRGTNTTLLASPAEWISPNPDGGYRDDPPAAEGTKVVLTDTDHLWGIGGDPQWVWKSFCRGLNPIFMDPYARAETTDAKNKQRPTWTDHLTSPPQLDPQWEGVRRAMGQTRRFAERMDLAATRPENRLASTGYCLAHAAATGAEYLVYLPNGGEVTVDLSASPGELAVEWFDPAHNTSARHGEVQGGASRTFQAPFGGHAVLYLTGRRANSARAAQRASGRPPQPLRVIIETDAGGDPDDEQSLVRCLVYANEFDFEGIIANRPAARDGENRNPIRDGLGIVRAQVKAYGECYGNLIQHDPRFPTAAHLLSRTVAGYDDTEDGVKLIIQAVDADDPRPVWFCNWGTDHGSAVSCLKRALDRVRRERGPEGYARFKSRLRLSSYDKFGEHTTTMEPPFSLWVDTFHPQLGKLRWYHRFSALTATAGGFDLQRDVRAGHGPLGALYPVNTGPAQKEGDTMAFLYLVPMGMNDPNEPGWGGWGGRYGPNEEYRGKPYFWANQADAWRGTTNRDHTLARWAADLQNDFRARMDWCVKSRAQANHRPIAVVNGQSGPEILRWDARSGGVIALDAAGSSDPDGNAVTCEWFVYGEAGTYRGEISLSTTNGLATRIIAPEVKKPETIHVILRVQDDGQPPLCGYRRAVVVIRP